MAKPSTPLRKTFRYGKSRIDYRLIYADRTNLAITVTPEKDVVVKAPLGTHVEDIESRLLRRGKWIVQQINYFDRFHPIQPARQYASGETHYYLGRQYRLRLHKGLPESVKLIGKFFVARVKDPEMRIRLEGLMKSWYADHAAALIGRRAQSFARQILGAGHPSIDLNYRYLQKQWGFRRADRSLTFNVELVKTPIDCIDYVIAHEVCHLVHANHDRAFYRLLRKTLPDWEARKEKLERFGAK